MNGYFDKEKRQQCSFNFNKKSVLFSIRHALIMEHPCESPEIRCYALLHLAMVLTDMLNRPCSQDRCKIKYPLLFPHADHIIKWRGISVFDVINDVR